jgi:hypothetical protein
MNDGLAGASRSVQASGSTLLSMNEKHRDPNGESHMSLKFYAAALALAVLPLTALAQSATAPAPEAREKFRAACGADVQKLCADVERGKGAIRSCLDTHEKELSSACKAARAERAAARAKEKS